jgi:hypothetical protein
MRTKKTITTLLLLVTLLLLILIIHTIGFSDIYSTIVQAKWSYLLAVVVLQASAIGIRNFKWQIFVNSIKKVPFFSLLVITLAGSFMDTATPGPQVGGGPLKAYFLSKRIHVDKTTCLSTVLVERIASVGVLSFLGLSSLFFVLVFIQNVPLTVKLMLELVLALLIGVPIMGYFVREKYRGKDFKGQAIIARIYYFRPFSFLRRQFKSLQAFDDYVRLKLGEFARTFSELSRDKNKVGVNVLLAFVFWILSFANTYALFLALGHHVSFFAIIIVISLATFLSYFMFMPGGAGVMELLLISLYISFGISSTVAAAVALLDRCIFYAFSLCLGYLSLIYLNFRYGKY